MRIVVHGQQAFGKAVLEKLLERNDNVVACAPRLIKMESRWIHLKNWHWKMSFQFINRRHGNPMNPWC